jgi:putative oxidoreductase
MSIVSKFEAWGDRHHPKLLDLIRIVLGAVLIFKGTMFYHNMPFLRDLIIDAKLVNFSPELITAILYYVTYAHLAGGALIVLGLVTRLAALLQIPIVFGAVFLVNIALSPVNSELWLSIVILVLLLVFVVIGSGPVSLDYLLTQRDSNKTPESPV